jgi:flagellar basal-body rod protein FlgC
MDVYQTWLDAIADNVANINNVSHPDEAAFQERFVVVEAQESARGGYQGAAVEKIELGDPSGRLVFQPEHPKANDEGFVRVPSVDLAQQMTHMLVAQRAYQANVSAFRAARDAYQRAMEIGR